MKVYVVRKLVLAKSVKEAMKIEKRFPADEIFIDEEFKKGMMGFNQK